jgi:hypothetical protein
LIGKKREKDMIKIWIPLFTFAFSSFCFSQSKVDSLYLGKALPGNTPEIFLKGVTERIAISPDGKEIIYGDKNGLQCYTYIAGQWTGPSPLFTGGAPALSFSGDTLYYMGGQPGAWFSVRSKTGRSAPTIFWNNLCSKHYIQPTNNGNYYLTTNITPTGTHGDISKLVINTKDTVIQSLGAPINSSDNGADFYVARDESYLIFVSHRNKSHALVISYHKSSGGWTNFKNLGTSINTPGWWPWGPFVTMDKKYLFFTKGSGLSNVSTYWVRIDNLIDSLRQTNFVPWVNKAIKDTSAVVGTLFSYCFPDSTFIDDDGNNTLTYSATLDNGDPLPLWLKFNFGTRTFSGIPTESGICNIKVIAADNERENVSCTFSIRIVNNSNLINKK